VTAVNDENDEVNGRKTFNSRFYRRLRSLMV